MPNNKTFVLNIRRAGGVLALIVLTRVAMLEKLDHLTSKFIADQEQQIELATIEYIPSIGHVLQEEHNLEVWLILIDQIDDRVGQEE
jgi:hypothetical protein